LVRAIFILSCIATFLAPAKGDDGLKTIKNPGGGQVNVPGVILNYVDTSLPEYYYYQYSEYYNTPVPVEEHDDVAAAAHRHHQPRQIQSS